MPFLDSAKIGPERFISYLLPYLTASDTESSLPHAPSSFALAVLGRKMLPVYAGGILLLLLIWLRESSSG